MAIMEGIALLSLAISLITFSVMMTSGPFSKHESCKKEEDND